MERISFGDLTRLVQSVKQGVAEISAERAASLKQDFFSGPGGGAFELDPDTSEAFRLRFRVNTDVVDVEGVERVALAAGHELALSALEITGGRGRVQVEADLLASYNIIAEGDSWFRHPFVKTVIEVLQNRGYRIRNLAWPGDTLQDIVAHKEYMPPLRAGTVTRFLLSGGGNDILGNIETIINPYNASYYDPNNASHVTYYIKSVFTTILNEVMGYYVLLNNDVRSASVNTLLMVHGYAYARPQEGGPFLGKHFEALGFRLSDPRTKVLAKAIVGELLDRLNRSLKTFAQTHRKVQYFDFRGILQDNDNDWFNDIFGYEKHELHPSEAGASKLADVYQPALPRVVIAELGLSPSYFPEAPSR